MMVTQTRGNRCRNMRALKMEGEELIGGCARIIQARAPRCNTDCSFLSVAGVRYPVHGRGLTEVQSIVLVNKAAVDSSQVLCYVPCGRLRQTISRGFPKWAAIRPSCDLRVPAGIRRNNEE